MRNWITIEIRFCFWNYPIGTKRFRPARSPGIRADSNIELQFEVNKLLSLPKKHRRYCHFTGTAGQLPLDYEIFISISKLCWQLGIVRRQFQLETRRRSGRRLKRSVRIRKTEWVYSNFEFQLGFWWNRTRSFWKTLNLNPNCFVCQTPPRSCSSGGAHRSFIELQWIESEMIWLD